MEGSRSPAAKRPERTASRNSCCNWRPSVPGWTGRVRPAIPGLKPDHSTQTGSFNPHRIGPYYQATFVVRCAMTRTLHPTSRALGPHGLDELIAALRGQIHHDGHWSATAASVADVLRAQLPAPTVLTAAERQGMPGRAAAHRLHVEPDGSFSVLAIVWRRDQWTRAHNHVSRCVFAALAGEVTEDLYELDTRSATLVAAGRRDCPAGTVRCEVPPGDIQRLGNRHGDPAITLHVYGTDVTRLGSSARRYYD